MKTINYQLSTISNLLLISIVFTSFLFSSPVSLPAQTEENSWYMAGANPERTSWVSEEVRGSLKVEWYKPIKPYISQKVQVIAANGLLYISTARGLYAIDADTGAEVWVYPTELPLGHSPTVVNGVAYVGGFDRKIHAINALTGKGLWTFEAGKGFQTNPLVVNNRVYAGNRDGYFYALDARSGDLVWQYPQQGQPPLGPILFSAAYKDNTLFFASNDSHAYALDATTGQLVWKSAKLPGSGFHSWWPVIYDDPRTGEEFIIFSGSDNYRNIDPYWSTHVHHTRFLYELPDGTYPQTAYIGPVTTEPDGSTTIDASKITEFFEEPTPQERTTDPAGLSRDYHKPWKRTVFYLHRNTGGEYTFDSDNDGQLEYAPILYQGTHSGTRYPPIVGGDGVIYQANNYYYSSAAWIPRGGIAGWDVGTHNLIKVPRNTFAVDEPLVYSGGANLIHWNLCCDRNAGSFDVTIPGSRWQWWDQGASLLYGPLRIPGYNEILYWGLDITVEGRPGTPPVFDYGLHDRYSPSNGIYGRCGDQNPLVPYQGRVYVILSNVLMALSPSVKWSDAVQLPMAEEVSAAESNPPALTESDLKQLLEAEIRQVINAGHLQPGFVGTGIADTNLRQYGDNLLDYWKTPGDIHYHLVRALPHLSPSLQQQVKEYLETEFESFPPYEYVHIGWAQGSQREVFERPPEVEAERADFPAQTRGGAGGWSFPPHQFYALWNYAQTMGEPALSLQIFNNSKQRLETPPADSLLIERPYVHNAYIAGYLGYINLARLAGLSEEELQAQQTELDRLLNLRVSTFSKDSPYGEGTTQGYARELSIARNFMFLVPELAAYLRDNLRTEIEDAVEEYDNVAPYWFVSKHEASLCEGIISPLYNYHAIFQAKAQILQEPREELLKYLDIPGVEIGDLFYIDNLVALIEAQSTTEPQPPLIGDLNNDGVVNILDLVIVGNSFGKEPGDIGYDSRADSNNSGGVIDIFDLILVGSNFGRSI